MNTYNTCTRDNKLHDTSARYALAAACLVLAAASTESLAWIAGLGAAGVLCGVRALRIEQRAARMFRT